MKTDMWGEKPRWYETKAAFWLLVGFCFICLGAYAVSEWL